MHARFVRSLFASLCLLATAASADTLALPDRLVDLRSPKGEAFLLEAQALDSYLPIGTAFVTQKTQAYCGVASMVMVLNAIGAPAPVSAEYQPYATFTQDNILDEKTDAILPRGLVARQGMTLDQLGALLSLHPVIVDVHHAAPGGLDAFRKSASEYLAGKDHFVVVNYLRKSLGQESGGHISPLAAYDPKADRFLILDVGALQIPARLGDGIGPLRRHEHDRCGQRQQDPGLCAGLQEAAICGTEAVGGRRGA